MAAHMPTAGARAHDAVGTGKHVGSCSDVRIVAHVGAMIARCNVCCKVWSATGTVSRRPRITDTRMRGATMAIRMQGATMDTRTPLQQRMVTHTEASRATDMAALRRHLLLQSPPPRMCAPRARRAALQSTSRDARGARLFGIAPANAKQQIGRSTRRPAARNRLRPSLQSLDSRIHSSSPAAL